MTINMKSNSLKLLFTVLFYILNISSGYGEDSGKYWDISIGSGINIDGVGSRQVLLAPGFSMKINDNEFLRLRIETDLELIDSKGHMTSVIGGAPFIRYYMIEKASSPFAELGLGANAITSNHVGPKDVGGCFLFSPMAGVGYQFAIEGRPMSFAYRMRHLSNADIYRRNEGINNQYLLLSIGL
jgi:hypothetical protein